jgi:hypothetical protein
VNAYRFASEDVGHVIKSLVYFGEADAAPLPSGLEEAHWRRVRSDFERWVSELP